MKRPRIISADEAAKLWATYQRVGSVMAAARLHRRNMNTLRKLFDRKGWLAIRPTPVWTNKQARAIYADYCRPMPQRQVGRKWGISGKSVRQLFMRRGLKLRPNKWEPKSGRRADGTIAKARPHTRKQLDAIIAGMDRLKIPQALNHEWRTWTLERRMEFIRSVRARLRNPKDRPETPFSKNVIPFDYGTPAAWEIVRKMNAGLNSRFWKIKLNLTSMGVIWRGQLFFWMSNFPEQGGMYQKGACGAYVRGVGRPALHHLIYEERHGCRLPAGSVVRFADDNYNNFDPENLVLITRNDVVRENQAVALANKSRALTAILLQRAQRKGGEQHGNDNTITILRQRHRV